MTGLEPVKDWFSMGICKALPQRSLHHVGEVPLLSGLFAVSKNEYNDAGLELRRLIMNLVPVNRLCLLLRGDVGRLPTIAGMSAFYLEGNEIAMLSSEDVKCFYYLFRILEAWHQFMGSARPVPSQPVPPEWEGEVCHLTSLVLPMGFINAVGIAQHVHQNVVRQSLQPSRLGDGSQELRRDRLSPNSRELYRVYLDNWDQKGRCASCGWGWGHPHSSAVGFETTLIVSTWRYLGIPRNLLKFKCGWDTGRALLDGREGV